MKSLFLTLREACGLEQDEAAEALGVSVETIEEYDSGFLPPPAPLPWLKRKFDVHLTGIRGNCSDLMFDTFPLWTFGILGYPLERRARLFGYSLEQWRKFELHQEPLPADILEKAERYWERRFAAHMNRKT